MKNRHALAAMAFALFALSYHNITSGSIENGRSKWFFAAGAALATGITSFCYWTYQKTKLEQRSNLREALNQAKANIAKETLDQEKVKLERAKELQWFDDVKSLRNLLTTGRFCRMFGQDLLFDINALWSDNSSWKIPDIDCLRSPDQIFPINLPSHWRAKLVELAQQSKQRKRSNSILTIICGEQLRDLTKKLVSDDFYNRMITSHYGNLSKFNIDTYYKGHCNIERLGLPSYLEHLKNFIARFRNYYLHPGTLAYYKLIGFDIYYVLSEFHKACEQSIEQAQQHSAHIISNLVIKELSTSQRNALIDESISWKDVAYRNQQISNLFVPFYKELCPKYQEGLLLKWTNERRNAPDKIIDKRYKVIDKQLLAKIGEFAKLDNIFLAKHA